MTFESEPVHEFFELSYSNYLVLHRTLLQSMPDAWQQRFITCVEELESSFRHIEQPETFFVQSAVERELWELSDFEMKNVLEGEVSYHLRNDDEFGGIYSVDGDEKEGHYRVHLPVSDPIPHYDRGRARIEPRIERPMREYPLEDGGVVVIGPECFATKDGAVLNWRGVNYVQQQATD